VIVGAVLSRLGACSGKAYTMSHPESFIALSSCSDTYSDSDTFLMETRPAEAALLPGEQSNICQGR